MKNFGYSRMLTGQEVLDFFIPHRRKNWPHVEDLFTPGVYGWYRNGQYLYIGSSLSMLWRVRTNDKIKRKDILPTDEFHFRQSTNRRLLEKKCQVLFQPLLDGHKKSNRRLLERMLGKQILCQAGPWEANIGS